MNQKSIWGYELAQIIFVPLRNDDLSYANNNIYLWSFYAAYIWKIIALKLFPSISTYILIS